LDVVVLEHSTIAFVQCEPDFWIVMTCSHAAPDATAGNPSIFYNHMPNGSGMKDAIVRMYRLFVNFFGEISTSLTGFRTDSVTEENCTAGWDAIETVHVARKSLRKLHLRLRQENADLEYLLSREADRRELTTTAEIEEFNSCNIPLDLKGLECIRAEIAETEKLIVEANIVVATSLNAHDYTPRFLSKMLGSFMGW
jgi:hypothetical protein